MPAIIRIAFDFETSEAGLSATRDEVAAFLSHLETQPGPRAATSWLVIRRLVNQLNATTLERQKQEQAKRPKPLSIREERRKAA